jgi:riboflavin synthase
MFTGIISSLGTVLDRKYCNNVAQFTFFSPHLQFDKTALGASVACSGACLTVIDKGVMDNGTWFLADVSQETLNKTTLDHWKSGDPVNFEKALCVGDELGGHFVSGHVDAVASVLEKRQEGASWFYSIKIPPSFERFIVPKGSVTLDGIALTVNHVHGDVFDVTIIPHTYENTTLKYRDVGSLLNFEIDLLARYIQNAALKTVV